MKITIYTTTDCQFSKQEKEYLLSHNLPYEEKNVETNREFLTEMLAVGNNFAGTPVTKIEKDDGQIVILKGFTLDEFNTTLALTPPPAMDQTTNNQASNNQASNPPAPPAPMPVVDEVPAAPTPVASAPVVPPPVEPALANDQLNSILNDLQKKAETTSADPTQQPMPVVMTPPPTVISQQPVVDQASNSQASNNQVSNSPSMPSIPDFKQN